MRALVLLLIFVSMVSCAKQDEDRCEFIGESCNSAEACGNHDGVVCVRGYRCLWTGQEAETTSDGMTLVLPADDDCTIYSYCAICADEKCDKHYSGEDSCACVADQGGYYASPLWCATKEGNLTSGSGAAVVILFDMSGSMVGFVDGGAGMAEVDLETSVISIAGNTDLGAQASDPGCRRCQALDNLAFGLSSEDTVGLFNYNETGIEYLCDGDLLEVTTPDAAAQCIGKSRAALLEYLESGKFRGHEQGRSPLWEAMDESMRALAALENENSHLIVITDGPDTCASPTQSSSDLLPPCSAATKDKFLGTQSAHPHIKIHSLRFQAPGYKDDDPDLRAIVEATGGQYHFVRQLDAPGLDDLDFEQAMADAAKAIWHSIDEVQ
jgi:hypothetical protein